MSNTVPYRAADYLMDRLVEQDVRDIFFLPGGGAMYLDDALACQEGINAIPCHHEQACGIAAEANGRTNAAGFGVALVTTGPGATNVLTPFVGAWIESLPLLVISGQVKRPDALNGRPLRQSGVQEVDVVSMVESVSKFAVTVKRPEDIRRCFEEALWHMRSGRPGPVLLDIPLDVQAAPVDPLMLEGFTPTETSGGDLDLKPIINNLAKKLSACQRPLMLVGHGVRISGGAEKLLKLAERYGIPCVYTWNASDIMHWDHPLYVGRPGVVAARAPNFALQNCDFLISIGCRLDNIITAYNPKGFARVAEKLVVDVDQNELDRHEMEISMKVCADAHDFLDAWYKQSMSLPDWQPWRERCASWKERFTPLDGRSFSNTGPMSHYQFVDALSEIVPEGSLVITGSSGLAVEVVYTVFRNRPGQRMFLTSGLGSMGYGLPAAIGACIGAGKVPTVCVESDGSLMLNLQELVTLKSLALPITLVIMNNNGYASIRNTQRNYFNGRYLGTGPDSGLLIPDFVDLCTSIGLPAVEAKSVEELETSLSKCFAQTVPTICVVSLEENEALLPKVAAIPQPDGSIISMPLEDMMPLLSLEQLQSEMIADLDERSLKVQRD